MLKTKIQGMGIYGLTKISREDLLRAVPLFEGVPVIDQRCAAVGAGAPTVIGYVRNSELRADGVYADIVFTDR